MRKVLLIHIAEKKIASVLPLMDSLQVDFELPVGNCVMAGQHFPNGSNGFGVRWRRNDFSNAS